MTLGVIMIKFYYNTILAEKKHADLFIYLFIDLSKSYNKSVGCLYKGPGIRIRDKTQ